MTESDVGWCIWYGLKIGLSYETAYALPFGELCDLIAVEQIRNEGAKMKKSKAQEEAEFWRLMDFVQNRENILDIRHVM